MKEIKIAMEAQEPGITVLELAKTQEGRIAYLIETPHSFPRFVVGLTDPELKNVKILVGCGADRTARARFAGIAA